MVIEKKKKLRGNYCRHHRGYFFLLTFLFSFVMVNVKFTATAQDVPADEEVTEEPSLTIRNSAEHKVQVNDLRVYCEEAYRRDFECPSEVCFAYFDKQEGDEAFVLKCKPKDCLNLSAINCPVDACRIMVGCDGNLICYPPDNRDPPKCGGLAYDGQEVECCEGFIKRCGLEYFDGSCDMSAKNSIYGVAACIPCGNGVCNQFENKCNCPEDCQ